MVFSHTQNHLWEGNASVNSLELIFSSSASLFYFRILSLAKLCLNSWTLQFPVTSKLICLEQTLLIGTEALHRVIQ